MVSACEAPVSSGAGPCRIVDNVRCACQPGRPRSGTDDGRRRTAESADSNQPHCRRKSGAIPVLGGLAAEVCQATGDGEAATGDGRVDEHAVAENVQEVGHAARCRARREASVRDGSPRSTRAATRATSRTWPGTGNEAEPQTCVPPVSMAARRSSQSSVPVPTSPHPCISGSPPRFTTYLIPGARPPVSAHESGSLGFCATGKGEPFRMGFASSWWYSTRSPHDRGAPFFAFREPPPHRGPR